MNRDFEVLLTNPHSFDGDEVVDYISMWRGWPLFLPMVVWIGLHKLIR